MPNLELLLKSTNVFFFNIYLKLMKLNWWKILGNKPMHCLPMIIQEFINGEIKPLMNFITDETPKLRVRENNNLICHDLGYQIFSNSKHFPKRRLPLFQVLSLGIYTLVVFIRFTYFSGLLQVSIACWSSSGTYTLVVFL